MGASEVGAHGDGDVTVTKKGVKEVQAGDAPPMYTMQALWDGKMTLKDFQVAAKDQDQVITVPHNVFEQDEALPVIDVAALLGTDREAREANIATMLEAAKTWGFFKIRNHGVPLEVVKKVEQGVKKFFAFPMERKLKVKAQNFAFGYVGGSPISWDSKWWMEGLNLKVQDEAIRNTMSLAFADDEEFAKEFTADVTSYFGTMRELSRMVVEILTECLGLEPDTFTNLETADAMCNARVNHYPACPNPSKVFGIHGHTDPQMMSILFQDEVGGLQVLRDGKWIGIRPDDSTFVVNLGDTFQVLSNGILHSAKHRVTLNTKRSRYATIYFYGIDNAMSLIVPPELVTKDRPLKYRPFTVNEYRAYLVQSQLPMDGVKFLEVQHDATQPATESEQ